MCSIIMYIYACIVYFASVVIITMHDCNSSCISPSGVRVDFNFEVVIFQLFCNAHLSGLLALHFETFLLVARFS